jgi:hypothetical protein
VTVFMVAEAEPGDVVLRELHKCEPCAWFAKWTLPRPLLQPLQRLMECGVRLDTL